MKQKYWIDVILWMAFIFVLSTDIFSSEHTARFIVPLIRFFAPSLGWPKVMKIHWLIRKCAHFAEYFVLGVLLFRAFSRKTGRILKTVLFSILIVAAFSASDEFHQSFTRSRGVELSDVALDTLAGTFALIISALLRLARGGSEPKAS